ncbi:hypothetical protein GCM10017562_76030 [Streptomyces roseofulvus]
MAPCGGRCPRQRVSGGMRRAVPEWGPRRARGACSLRGAQEGAGEQVLSWFAPASGREVRFGLQLARAR